MAGKYRLLNKVGEVKIGMHLYKKADTGAIEGPFVIMKLYTKHGIDVIDNSGPVKLEDIGQGSKAVWRNDGASVMIFLADYDVSRFYIKPDYMYEVEPDAEATVE